MTTHNRLQALGISLPTWVFLAAFGITLATAHNILTDQDPFWHIAAGNWTIAHRTITSRDVYSFSMPGAPWIRHDWLSQVILAAFYDHFGWTGVVVATAFVLAATLAFLTALLRHDLPPAPTIVAVVGALGLCLPHLHARPFIFGLPLLVGWIGVLVSARCNERAPSPAFALLIALWANMHGGYAMGLTIAALMAGEALFEAPDTATRLRVVRTWGLFLAVSLLATVATPNGVSGLLAIFEFSNMSYMLSLINEWKSPDFHYPQPLELWLFLLLLGALTLRLTLPVTRIVMLLFLLHEALAYQRFAEILGLAAPLLMAPALGVQLGFGPTQPLNDWIAKHTSPRTTWGAVVAVLLAFAAMKVLPPVTNDDPHFAPRAAVQFAQDHHVTGHVFNSFNFGGYLIFAGIAPFIDGRADMYGDAFLKRAETPSELPALLQQYDISWTLLKPDDARVAMLDLMPAWRRSYSDQAAVVHVRVLPDEAKQGN